MMVDVGAVRVCCDDSGAGDVVAAGKFLYPINARDIASISAIVSARGDAEQRKAWEYMHEYIEENNRAIESMRGYARDEYAEHCRELAAGEGR
ncbi:MAG: hypothetical protein ACPG4T_16925 [Nannocystaceae bacterium]